MKFLTVIFMLMIGWFVYAIQTNNDRLAIGIMTMIIFMIPLMILVFVAKLILKKVF